MGRYTFGPASRKKLYTCHPVMIEIVEAAMFRTPMDFTVTEGWRNKAGQDAAVKKGASKTPWPTSKHNHMLNGKPASLAVDVAPWWPTEPHIRWDRTNEFRWLAGFIMGAGAKIAEERGFRIRWLGDSDMDGDHTEAGKKVFVDLPHVEIVPL